MSNLTFLMSSYDSYEDLWEPFFINDKRQRSLL